MVGGELVEDFVEAVGLDGADDLVRALDESSEIGLMYTPLRGRMVTKPSASRRMRRHAGGLADFEGFADAVLIEELAIPQFPSAHGVLEVLIDTLSEGIDFWFLAKGGIFDDLFRMFHPCSPVFS